MRSNETEGMHNQEQINVTERLQRQDQNYQTRRRNEAIRLINDGKTYGDTLIYNS